VGSSNSVCYSAADFIGLDLVAKKSKATPYMAVRLKLAWKTAVVLLGYGVLIEGRRWFWTPEQGNKAFSPIFNDANSFFFREFLWLIFILEVIPIAGCSSGILYHLQSLADGTLSGVPHAK
jgi:hypothetical protein